MATMSRTGRPRSFTFALADLGAVDACGLRMNATFAGLRLIGCLSVVTVAALGCSSRSLDGGRAQDGAGVGNAGSGATSGPFGSTGVAGSPPFVTGFDAGAPFTSVGQTATGGQTGIGGQTGAGGSDQPGGGSSSCPGSSPDGGVAFAAPVEYPTNRQPLSVAVGDLNGDGKPDLVVVNALEEGSVAGVNAGTGGIGGIGTGSVSVFLSSASGFGPPVHYRLGSRPSAVAIGDLDGDAKPDVAVVDVDGVAVLLNDGSGALLPPMTFSTGSGPLAVALGDLDGDGKADLAVANRGTYTPAGMPVNGDVAILLNRGSGVFVATNYAAGPGPTAVALGDLDGDGNSDLAVASGTGVIVLINGGKGTFPAPVSYAAGTNPNAVAIGDLNGDAKPDLALGRGDAASGSQGGASVAFNVGNGTFTAAVNYKYAAGYGSLVIGDVDGDGHPDLAGPAGSDCGGAALALNGGKGTFPTVAVVGQQDGFVPEVRLADLNGDGKLDLVVPHGESVGVFLNAR